MRFNSTVPIINGATDPSPISSPGTVPANKLTYIPPRPQTDVDEMTKTGQASFSAPAGETVTVSLWAIDDSSLPQSPNPATIDFTPAQIATLRFYLIAAGVVVTANTLVNLASLAGGYIYVQQTAESVAADRILQISARS